VASPNASVQIDELVISSLAAAEATLDRHREGAGVMVADIGGGTTDLPSSPMSHLPLGVLPVGAINVTNDVAIGLRTSLDLAEEIKIKHGSATWPTSRRGAAQRRDAGRGGRTDDQRRSCARSSRLACRDLLADRRGGEALRHVGLLPAGWC